MENQNHFRPGNINLDKFIRATASIYDDFVEKDFLTGLCAVPKGNYLIVTYHDDHSEDHKEMMINVLTRVFVTILEDIDVSDKAKFELMVSEFKYNNRFIARMDGFKVTDPVYEKNFSIYFVLFNNGDVAIRSDDPFVPSSVASAEIADDPDYRELADRK